MIDEKMIIQLTSKRYLHFFFEFPLRVH